MCGIDIGGVKAEIADGWYVDKSDEDSATIINEKNEHQRIPSP